MNPDVTATWSNFTSTNETDVSSYEEAKKLITSIEAEESPPFLIEFYFRASKRSIGIGIGRNLAVVTYQQSLDPPYYISLGNTAADGVDWFCYGEERTEYLSSNMVSIESAYRALREFFSSNVMPTTPNWERL